MINDYGLKSFHFVVESGEIEFEVEKDGFADVEIPVNGKFDIIGMPSIKVNRKVDFEIKYFSENKFAVRVINNTGRKKKGKIIYEIRGLRVWT